ncbi:hypothetical protein KQH50_01925 [bacterium]|nr:hypothetical protein [bacterium]
MPLSISNKKVVNIFLFAAIIGLLLGLVAFAYMGSFMRIIGDDYFYAAVLEQNGFWNGQIHAYMNHMLFHGDRYTLNFFSLFFSLFPPKINAIIPTLVILIYLDVLYNFLTALLARLNISTSNLLRWTLSLVISFFTFWLAPTVNQGLYWRSSMLPSFGPIIGTLFLAALVLKPQQLKWHTALITFLLALINAGLSENGAAYQAMMAGILFIGWLWAKYKNAKNTDRMLILSILVFTAAIAGVLIMWNSPGIAHYQEDMSTTLISTTLLSVRHAINHYKEMLISRFLPFVILIVLGFSAALISNRGMKKGNPTEKKSFLFWVLVLILIQLIVFLFILSLTTPSAFIRNLYPDPRHFMGSIMMIITSMVATGYVLGTIVNDHMPLTQKSARIVLISAAILFGTINLIYPVWTIPQITAERLKFQYWASVWDERHQEILNAAANGNDTIHVVQMDHIIEDVAELSQDPSTPWYNLPASQYYGIEIIADLPGWDEGYAEFIQNKQ